MKSVKKMKDWQERKSSRSWKLKKGNEELSAIICGENTVISTVSIILHIFRDFITGYPIIPGLLTTITVLEAATGFTAHTHQADIIPVTAVIQREAEAADTVAENGLRHPARPTDHIPLINKYAHDLRIVLKASVIATSTLDFPLTFSARLKNSLCIRTCRNQKGSKLPEAISVALLGSFRDCFAVSLLAMTHSF